MINDQRRHLRLPASALESTIVGLQQTLVLNLSESGVRLQLEAPVAVAQPVRVRCNLTASNSLFEATGQIVWTDSSAGQAGVRFLSVPELSRARLIEWLFHSALARCVPSASNAGTSANSRRARATPEVEAVLHLMATRAQLVTRADGAAIALAEGEGMLCRASSGAVAPQHGTRTEAESGLALECLHTGELVVCADAETDSRPSLANCRALGIRSAIVLPLRQRTGIRGLLGVFSERAYAFDGYDIDTLKRMAASIVGVAFGEQREAEPAAAA